MSFRTITKKGKARSKPGRDGEKFRSAVQKRKAKRKNSKQGRKASRRKK